jgi:PTS system nitrogen regulatory IIA component
MAIAAFLNAEDVISEVRAPDKVRLLQDLSQRAASATKLDSDIILAEILKRESLGSTGMGGGVAIPHARFQNLKKPFGLLARLRKGIDFDAIDGQPVDIVFLLLLPADAGNQQLNALASVTRKLRNAETLDALRRAADGKSLYHAMTAMA